MVYSRLRTTDTTHFNHPQILKTMTMCMDLWVKLEGNANGLIMPFLRKDVQEMINMHVTTDTLHSAIPLESLPNEYGGKAGTFEDMDKSFKEKLYAHRDWFKETENKYLVDESKREHTPKRFMFGLFG
ncbi:hypothetical protein AND_004352 [Anopheles darlingi]|uniref:CRAL-TRIO domain-containing protein n=1 Tax=Anopheles darlingi TaxID=43151 RepID=W5JII9_ANODA|nr:hypothetical protein AND_004352 [Anopheles darlingi]